ncbi:hypothetical protein EDB92DRAFT_2089513 [Lactarius akahatsu]|uniref:Uncharacterized protein n=1 Tax=Lactarius akahatsu TaxID=416441 RepID=A0AAD4LF84_9AGAM|nr:hypothetical protein EDB92DRAFT_2089513 [Lactarius akahatsu]
MDIVPIPLYTINLILQYICPPSQLITPIPSNLLSLSLLQRHRLLDITLTDTSSYLTWPSSGRDRAIQHLESLPMPLDELAPDFLVGYAADTEHAYAHVHVKSTGDDGLRLVFEWDGEESWKYHDSNVMPFPPGTHQSLSDAVAGADTITIPVPESKGPKSGNGGDDTDDDDDYWNSYGAEDAYSMQPSPSVGRDEVDASEDAYWARYASVQGSADSTVPSPVHKTTRKLQAPHEVSHAETLPILTADIRSRLRDPKAPPSPNTLARRLTALSPRPVITSPLSAGFSEPGPEDDIPDATDDDTESPSSLVGEKTPWETGTVEKNQEEPVPAFNQITNLSSRHGVDQDDDGLAVQDAVRGLFWLWKTTRRGSTPERTGESSFDEHDRADFLQLVGRAIAVPR